MPEKYIIRRIEASKMREAVKNTYICTRCGWGTRARNNSPVRIFCLKNVLPGESRGTMYLTVSPAQLLVPTTISQLLRHVVNSPPTSGCLLLLDFHFAVAHSGLGGCDNPKKRLNTLRNRVSIEENCYESRAVAALGA